LGAAVSESRLASVCAVVTECGVCAGLAAGGLAAGGPAAGRIGMWQLATTAVVLLAISQLAVACAGRPAGGGRLAAGQWTAARYGVTWRTLAFPYGGRVLLIAVAAPALGARAALFGLLGGAVGCSRAVTMAGWRPHSDQVGQTGTKIAPELYIPCGISGATQHMAGCKGAKRLLAINPDGEASIFASADYAVIGDLHEVVPAISAEIRKARGT